MCAHIIYIYTYQCVSVLRVHVNYVGTDAKRSQLGICTPHISTAAGLKANGAARLG